MLADCTFAQSPLETTRPDTAVAEIELAMEKKDFSLVLKLAGEWFETVKKGKDTVAMAQSLYFLSRASALLGDFESAIDYGEMSSHITRELEACLMEYKASSILSWAYFMTQSPIERILAHQERQVFLVDRIDDRKAKALVYNNYGYDVTVSGTLPINDAITYMRFANDYYASEEGHKGRWYTLMNLTWQYRLRADYSNSEKYGYLSIEQARKEQDRHAIIEAFTNLGETLLAQNKLMEADTIYREAFEWGTKEVDRDKYVFDVYYSHYLWYKGEIDKAITLADKAISFLETSEVFYEMLGRSLLAKYYYTIGEYDKGMDQITVIENPRSDYISFETRFIAALIKNNIMIKRTATKQITEAYKDMINKAQLVEAEHLVKLRID